MHSVSKSGCGGSLIYVNNRLKLFERIRHAETVHGSSGRYIVYREHTDAPYLIEGGKAAGGSRTDWFVDGPGLPPNGIRARSLIDALNLVNEL